MENDMHKISADLQESFAIPVEVAQAIVAAALASFAIHLLKEELSDESKGLADRSEQLVLLMMNLVADASNYPDEHNMLQAFQKACDTILLQYKTAVMH